MRNAQVRRACARCRKSCRCVACVSKASALYRADWDLVGAVESGKNLAEVPADELPAELKGLEPAERDAFVREKAERRQELQQRIGELAAARSEYIAKETRENTGATGLDAAILEGLREVAATKGFSFVSEE